MQLTQFMQYLDEAQTVRTQPGLSNMQVLLAALGSPHTAYACVHIAGTNGKGSTAALLGNTLQRAGYKTGLFTSPHISRLNERIRIDGGEIADDALLAHAQAVQAAEQSLGIRLNFFQILTAIGFLHFARQGCDIAIIEAGLGGRLDPTNVLPAPAVAVIGRIGMDHTALLGDTIEKIAAEKAGIVKPGGEVVLLCQQPEAEQPVIDACARQGARLHKACALPVRLSGGELYAKTDIGELHIGLSGSYQAQNASLAYCAVRVLRRRGFAISDDAVREGFACARWPARFELLRDDPPLLFDGAHNPQGAQSLYESLAAYYPGSRCVFLMSAMRDKDAAGCIAAVAPLAAAMIAMPLDHPRAFGSQELAALMREHCDTVYAVDSVGEGLHLAHALAQPGDVLCGFGSLYLAQELRTALLERDCMNREEEIKKRIRSEQLCMHPIKNADLVCRDCIFRYDDSLPGNTSACEIYEVKPGSVLYGKACEEYIEE